MAVVFRMYKDVTKRNEFRGGNFEVKNWKCRIISHVMSSGNIKYPN